MAPSSPSPQTLRRFGFCWALSLGLTSSQSSIRKVAAFAVSRRTSGNARAPSLQTFSRPSNRSARSRGRLSSSSLDDLDSLDQLPTETKPLTSFPPSAYYLSKDEENIKYTFISFVDRTFASSYDQITRLIEPRSYARPNQFEKDAMHNPPTIDDIASPPSLYGPMATFLAWNRLPARMIVGSVAYIFFPLLLDVLEVNLVSPNSSQEQIGLLVNTFLPGVSIVLGTYFSLTLSILYERFSRMQQTIALEASLLALTYHLLVDLFGKDANLLAEGVQCIADQIGTLVRESRGRETMRVMYSDPYARILNLVQRERHNLENLDSVRMIRLSVHVMCESGYFRLNPLLQC
jgi:hypothetical protein